jgi:hypothetical protein
MKELEVKTEELIEKINSLEIIQNEWYEEQSFSEEIDDIIHKKCKWKEVIDESSHRWYRTGIQIFENTDGKHFGVSFVIELKSESMSTEDCYHKIKAFEVEEFVTKSYKLKK